MGSADPRVFTIVLNYRSAEDTVQCLRSVRQSTYRNQFLVIVDNASSDGSVDHLRHEFPAIRLIEASENLGYAGGNNLAIERALEAKADFVWLLNPDTTVEADTLELLLADARLHPESGLIGPRVLYGGSRPLTISSDGGRIDAERGGATENLNDGVPVDQVPPSGSYEVDYVTGSCLLVRASVFEDVGLLPEEYFLYFEETDLAKQATDAGWTARVAPEARVHHYKRSFGSVPTPYYLYYYIRGRLLFARRFPEVSIEEAERDLDEFISRWRRRVADNAPASLETFDRIVAWALDDGRAAVSGRRDDVHDLGALGT